VDAKFVTTRRVIRVKFPARGYFRRSRPCHYGARPSIVAVCRRIFVRVNLRAPYDARLTDELLDAGTCPCTVFPLDDNASVSARYLSHALRLTSIASERCRFSVYLRAHVFLLRYVKSINTTAGRRVYFDAREIPNYRRFERILYNRYCTITEHRS